MAVPQEQYTAQTADYKERALVLNRLYKKKGDFSPAEHQAYSALRDACIKKDERAIAQGMAALSRHLTEDPPSPAPPQVEAREAANDTGVPEASPQTMPPLRFIERSRLEPFRVSAVGKMPELPVPPSSNDDPEPKAEAPAPVVEAVTPRAEDMHALKKEVEEINNALNEFAHGKAFQWLKDPESGYREYMELLRALRSDLAEPRAEIDLPSIRARVETLRTTAHAVEQKVGIERPQAPEPVVETEAPPPPVAVPPPPVLEPVPEVPVVPQKKVFENKAGDLGLAAEPAPEPQAPLPAAESAVVSQLPPTPEPTPAAVTLPPEEVPVAVTEAPQASPAEAAVPEHYAPAVEKELEKLLAEWLGGVGLFGLKKVGIKNPEWQKMKVLRVSEVMENEGVVPEGLTYEALKNLTENLHAWVQAYHIPLMQYEHKTVDDLMHAIVFESISGKG